MRIQVATMQPTRNRKRKRIRKQRELLRIEKRRKQLEKLSRLRK
jgi:hypothetical protein